MPEGVMFVLDTLVLIYSFASDSFVLVSSFSDR